jgi:hypothetical protein
MTLRVIPAATDDPSVLGLAGRLAAAEVPVLERSAGTGLRVLDLSDLMSADDQGIALLRRLRHSGVELRNVSRYIELLLG